MREMKIIATHLNADFDGFAAMVGLWKLHPDAHFVFPGSKEPGLRHFLKETSLQIPEINWKDVSRVDHLILVDVGREDRLGPLAKVLHQEPRPFLEIYDHHPKDQVTIEADRLFVHDYGSTTTVVVTEIIRAEEEGMAAPHLSSLEASILLTGIYEDTANFMSVGTTTEDFQAAIYLQKHGAEISVVNRLLTHRLQPDQVAFFNTMVSSFETIVVEGTSIVLSVFSWPSFIPEAAYLVHRLMDLEPIDVFFALVLMDKRVHVIARSISPDVDVGFIVHFLGGGGHKMAASAVMKGVTLIEAREKLMAVLHQNLQKKEKAADIMKTSIIQIESKKSLSDAAKMMNRFRINSLVVAEGPTVVGTISRQVVDGAIFHGLGARPVRDYMGTDFPLMDPATPVSRILDRMITGRTRFVLVGTDPSQIQGIITRMDLLRRHYELTVQPVLRKGKRAENIRAMLRKRLPNHIHSLLKESGEVAERTGMRVYLVGGMVRDLLMHRENTDVDLVVEGDGIRFAQEFNQVHSSHITTHSRFGTARLKFSDGFKIDIATARTESYHAPAALPQVAGGILRQDLYRRDFTINTLAIDLRPDFFGDLIDYFGGWDDLHHGVIRVLHSLSFIDDPTRAMRAIRFAGRFNFRISDDTARLIASAVESRVLDKLSGKRFWTELRNLFLEEHPIASIRMLHNYGLLQFIHPQITLDAFLLELLHQLESVLAWFHLNFMQEKPRSWLIYLMAFLEKLDRIDRIGVARRFQLLSDTQDILRYYKSHTRDIRARLLTRENPKASDLYFSLREYPLEVLLYAMARSGEERLQQLCSVYLRDLQNVRLEISGKDLLDMGMPQGPQIRHLLDRVLQARLNGEAPDRSRQLEIARHAVQELDGETAGNGDNEKAR